MRYIFHLSCLFFVFSFLSCEPIEVGGETNDNYYRHELSVTGEDGSLLFQSCIDESLFSAFDGKIDGGDFVKSVASASLSEKEDIRCVQVTVSGNKEYYLPFSVSSVVNGGDEKWVADICLLSDEVSFTAADRYRYKLKAHTEGETASRTFEIRRKPADIQIALVVKEGSVNIHYYYATLSSSLPPMGERRKAELTYNGTKSSGYFTIWDRSTP